MLKIFSYFMALTIVFCIGFVAGRIKDIYPSIAKLEKPLNLSVQNTGETYKLPSGTSLYYSHSTKEGIDVYTIYLFVEGIDFELKKAEQRWPIYPLHADVWGNSD